MCFIILTSSTPSPTTQGHHPKVSLHKPPARSWVPGRSQLRAGRFRVGGGGRPSLWALEAPPAGLLGLSPAKLRSGCRGPGRDGQWLGLCQRPAQRLGISAPVAACRQHGSKIPRPSESHRQQIQRGSRRHKSLLRQTPCFLLFPYFFFYISFKKFSFFLCFFHLLFLSFLFFFYFSLSLFFFNFVLFFFSYSTFYLLLLF